MPVHVFVVVLFAALLHASWNAIVKRGTDQFLTTVMVTAAAACVAAVTLPFLSGPHRASWPCIAWSALFQIVYFLLIARTYRVADMSRTYPLMRGTAPLLVALVSVFQAGDALSPIAWSGIIGICVGIFSLAIGGKLDQRQGVYLALLNAFVIAGYTLIDGFGVRRSGAPAAYTLWVFLLTGVPLTLWTLIGQPRKFIAYILMHWRAGSVGGVGTTASYGLALWAMTMAPIAVVAALRETSILFGTMIAGYVLKEHIGVRRVLAACIIAGSAAVLRMG